MQNETATPAERATFVRDATARVLGLFLDQMLAALAAGSTADTSLTERAMLMAVRPWLPQLRGLVLSKISSSDGAQLELVAGAMAQGIDELLEAAPGHPLPRQRPIWNGTSIELVPVAVPLEDTVSDAPVVPQPEQLELDDGCDGCPED